MAPIELSSDEIVIIPADEIQTTDTALCELPLLNEFNNSLKTVETNLSRLTTTTGGSLCRKLQVAQVYDASMISRYGGNASTSAIGVSILNMVEGVYTGQFTMDIQFELVAEAFDPGITTDPSSFVYLDNFEAWANAGGFGTLDYDMANLWTNQGFSDGVRGRASSIGGICTNNRYTILSGLAK